MGKFVTKTGKNGEFFFSLQDGDGHILLTSEGYNTTASRDNGIESVKKNAADDHRIARLTATSGKPYFTLKAANGQVIGKSKMFESAEAMEHAIAAVKTHAPAAETKHE